jgi:hypothetical protein
MTVLPAVALLCAMALTGLADSGLISQHRASARSYARVRALSGTSTVVAGGALVGAALAVALPGAMAYGRDMHPAFRAIRDMVQAAAHTRPGAVFAHHALGQPLEIEAASTLAALEPPIRYEWLGVADYWLRGGTAQVWFLADPKRTDLALIDPESRRDVTRYRWAVATRPELGGSRPLGADWYRIAPPGWFVGEGWSLSLEAGGVAVASGKGLDHGAIEAYVRSRPERAWMMVGGRDLAAPASPASVLEVAIDGRVVDTWRLDPRKGANFLRTIELADGVPPGSGAYARLTVAAHAEEAGVPTPPVAIRQFDLQSDSGLIYGFGEGWHEEEADDSGRRWRWTSERSALHILPPQSVEIVLRGESPLKYFDAAPTIRLTAGDRTIDSLRPAGDFEWRVRVPLEDVKRSKGVVTLETDRVYLPSAAEGSADTRHLGLRLYEIAVNPTSVGLTPQTGRR